MQNSSSQTPSVSQLTLRFEKRIAELEQENEKLTEKLEDAKKAHELLQERFKFQ